MSPEELRQTAATLLANDLEAFTREAWSIIETAFHFGVVLDTNLRIFGVGHHRQDQTVADQLPATIWQKQFGLGSVAGIGICPRWWQNQVDLLLIK